MCTKSIATSTECFEFQVRRFHKKKKKNHFVFIIESGIKFPALLCICMCMCMCMCGISIPHSIHAYQYYPPSEN